MKHAGWLIVVLCSIAFAAPCPAGQPDQAALIKAEQDWAQALERSDTATLGCILADEFEDANPSGALSDRSTVLSRTEKNPGSHHRLSEMHAHVYGDVGYIRGLATALTSDGRPKAIVRFTDVYVYRDGRWQCVAGHESELPMEHP
jgi:ketosteroid isomerase-like protein